MNFRKYEKGEIDNISGATLAWIGDAVYSLMCREYELNMCNGKPNKLHIAATKRVNAAAQAESLEKIKTMLTTEEQDVVRRAINTPIRTKSKHYGIAEYKKATGFEALFGYLYLLGETARMTKIINLIFGE